MTGIVRFEYYLLQLDEHFLKAASEEDPALYLLKVDARSTLFRLEALSRIYYGVYDTKFFKKLIERFKELEDLLGKMDEFFAAENDLSKEDAKPEMLSWLNTNGNLKAADLNNKLKKDDWLNGKRLKKIRRKLADVSWEKPKKEIKKILNFIKYEIAQIIEFHSAHFIFTELESQVHEMRRKLRWLSIYPHALQGAVQFTDSHPNDPSLLKYQTQEIVLSPFNRMPDVGNNHYLILFEKSRFLALSWMISALGRLKDKGLLKEISETAAKNSNVENIPIEENINEAEILKESSEICRSFFDEKQLIQLVYGIGEV
ncbi:MAG: hypothetical protein ABIP69_06400 [Ferruginibacter sp.]